jgi:hypothetical protein
MKAFNHRHPNMMLAFWVTLWAYYALGAVYSVLEGSWGWVIVLTIATYYADKRCAYWYNRPWQVKK